MPNWCYSGYKFKFSDEEQAKKFAAVIERAEKVKTDGQDFGYGWLGNILIACGYPYNVEKNDPSDRGILRLGNEKMPAPDYRYRGSISYYDRYESEVEVQTETAWNAMPGVFGSALLNTGFRFNTKTSSFDGVDVRWWSEEPGNCVYCGSDAETCGGDIRVQLECNGDKYDTDERLSDIFDYDACWRDAGSVVQEITTEKKDLLKDINAFVYKNDKDSYKDNLDDAIKAIKEAYPDYGIEFYITEYEFYGWLSDDEITELEKEQDKILEGEWDELSDIPFDEDEEGTLYISRDWNGFKKGDSRDEIWHYFDRYHTKGIHYLLYERNAA